MAKFEVPTLSYGVLVWDGGVGVVIKKAWNEWSPTKSVLNLANVERRNKKGLVQLSNSVRLHGANDAPSANDAQAKVLKGAKAKQVVRYGIWIIIVAIHHCVQLVQGT